MDFEKLFFRADYNAATGFGHISRMNAIAGYFENKKNILLTHNKPDLDFLISNFDEVIEIDKVLDPLKEAAFLAKNFLRKDILFLDGYSFSKDYIHLLRNEGNRVIYIDDFGNEDIECEIVINPGLFDSNRYRRAKVTFCGSQYSVVRKDFLLNNYSKAKSDLYSNSVFIGFGGACPDKIIQSAVNAVISVSRYEKITLLCSNNQLKNDLLQAAKKNNKMLTFISSAASHDIITYFQQSALAILPSSTIALEACNTGIGLLTGFFVENQKSIYSMLCKYGAALPIGNMNELQMNELSQLIESISTLQIQKMVLQQRKYFTGKLPGDLSKALIEII